MVFGVFAFPLIAIVFRVELWKAGVLFLIAGAFWWNSCVFMFQNLVDQYYEIRNGEDGD
jgi:hypothetical protein